MDDTILATAAARGDQQAFAALVERYRRYIHAIAWKIVLNEEDALDITQNVLLTLARKIGDWNGRGPLRAWLAAIAAREALGYRRKASRRDQPTEPETLEVLINTQGRAESRQGPREALELEQRRGLVDRAMGQISPQQRAIFALRFREELGPGQIAERLGLPPAQVRSQLTRAIVRLRELLREEMK